MLIDSQNEFSDDQTLAIAVGDQASSNLVDLSVDRDIGKGEPVPLLVQITDDATSGGAGTLQVLVQSDGDVAFGSPSVLYTSEVIALATLVAGYKFLINFVPRANERYVRVLYRIGTADLTGGTVHASMGSEDQTNLVNV